MPRRELAGGLHHVTARAPKGLVLFRTDADRRHYLDLLRFEVAARGWSLRSYCLMDTHIHLLVLTPETNLGLGMKRLHETYVTYLHRTYDTHGHGFGDRFKNRLVLTDSHLFACLRYIARNPVAAGMVAAAADWPWSAHRALAGLTRSPAFLDVRAVHDLMSTADYSDLVGKDNTAILEELARHYRSDWMVRAKDEHQIPIAFIASHLGLATRTTYRRLAAQRGTEGTVS